MAGNCEFPEMENKVCCSNKNKQITLRIYTKKLHEKTTRNFYQIKKALKFLLTTSVWRFFYTRWRGWWLDPRMCIWITRVSGRISHILSNHISEKTVCLGGECIGARCSICNEVRNSFSQPNEKKTNKSNITKSVKN